MLLAPASGPSLHWQLPVGSKSRQAVILCFLSPGVSAQAEPLLHPLPGLPLPHCASQYSHPHLHSHPGVQPPGWQGSAVSESLHPDMEWRPGENQGGISELPLIIQVPLIQQILEPYCVQQNSKCPCPHRAPCMEENADAREKEIHQAYLRKEKWFHMFGTSSHTRCSWRHE